MIYFPPKNGVTLDGNLDRVIEADGYKVNLHDVTTMVFADDGGMHGTRRGFWSNAATCEVEFGHPNIGTLGSPRLEIEHITFIKPTRLMSLYNSAFHRCWWVHGGDLLTGIDYAQRDTWPSNIDFLSCHAQQAKVEIRVSDFRWIGGSIERCGEVVLGHITGDPALDHDQPEKGGGYVECRFESDGDQVVHVGKGVTVCATSATLTRFVRHPGAGLVHIRANHGSEVVLPDGMPDPTWSTMGRLLT